MLIGTGGVGIADDDGFLLQSGTDTVRNDAVVGKITAADDITGPGGGNGNGTVGEKALLVAVGHQLRAGLGVGVGIVAVQLIVLPVTPDPFPVQVDLIRGHIQEGTAAGVQPQAL